MKKRIVARLRETQPAVDPREALAGIPQSLIERIFVAPLVPAAVLVPLVVHGEDLSLLLTRRADSLRDHPGEISFPGGRLEAHEHDPVTAAVRECREELGVAAEYIDVIGFLRPQAVITGFSVSPVVGMLRPGFVIRPDPQEVAEAFAVPLEFFLDPGNLQTGSRIVHGIKVPMYVFQFGPYRIWGATAQILHSLCEAIR